MLQPGEGRHKLRQRVAGCLLCGLAGAVLVVTSGGRSRAAGLAESGAWKTFPAMVLDKNAWKPFPLAGQNERYRQIAGALGPAFEAGPFSDAGSLPPIGFDRAPPEGWNGSLPAEPIRENEAHHGLVARPFARLPAVEQANISKIHALQAAEVAKKAYSGEGEEVGDKGEAEEGAGSDEAPEAEARAVDYSRTQLRLPQQHRQTALRTRVGGPRPDRDSEEAIQTRGLQQEMWLAQQKRERALRLDDKERWRRDEAASLSRQDVPRSAAPDSERAALLEAKRVVDRALRRLADKHKALERSARARDSDFHAGEGGVAYGVAGSLAEARRKVYRHFAREYQAALRQTDEGFTPRRFEKRETPPVMAQARTRREGSLASVADAASAGGGVGFSDDAPLEVLQQRSAHVSDAREVARRFARVSHIPKSGELERASIVRDVPARNWPLVGQYGHTHAWPYVAMDGDMVTQNEDPVAPTDCVTDPIAVDCTGGFGGGAKSSGGPMGTRVEHRHDNELGWRPEVDGPIRVPPALQAAWNRYYGYAGGARLPRDISGGDAGQALRDPQELWDRNSERGVPHAWTAPRHRFSARQPWTRSQLFSPLAPEN